MALTAVGGTVREFAVGEDGVLRWSPPVPPNGIILYYNVIITRSDSGEPVAKFEQMYQRNIDVALLNSGVYNVQVKNTSFS